MTISNPYFIAICATIALLTLIPMKMRTRTCISGIGSIAYLADAIRVLVPTAGALETMVLLVTCAVAAMGIVRAMASHAISATATLVVTAIVSACALPLAAIGMGSDRPLDTALGEVTIATSFVLITGMMSEFRKHGFMDDKTLDQVS